MVAFVLVSSFILFPFGYVLD